ncbi:MAG: ATP-dependent 6-phosphofructokinase [Thermoleophilia bacterium]|nr:ATP-dependent 6-phosphofructokinase [Thermoleophilia bacterium]
MKRIAVVTSGGDAPGMNAAVRAIVRVGTDIGMDMFGVRNGFEGLIGGDIMPLSNRDVSEILHLGGTFLGTARSIEFRDSRDARERAVENLHREKVDGLIVIGGNGSQAGAHELGNMGLPVVGVASTVDNDLFGSDISIGVDTALDIIIESIDRIRTTAESHHRAFLIEVMGKTCGYLALASGLAGGADVIVTPEFDIEPAEVEQQLAAAHNRGKRYALAVVTDGARNNAERCMEYFRSREDEIGYELRVTILGHVQRGGAPSTYDRILASRLGAAAVEFMAGGGTGQLVGWIDGAVTRTPLEEVAGKTKQLDLDLWQLLGVLAK